jgi:hypothetical protein
MKRALTHGTRICQIVDGSDDEFPVYKDFIWVDVADDTVPYADTWVDGAVVKYIEPVLTWYDLRSKRNSLLDSSDWTQGFDSPLSDEVKDAWTVYRQSLRDLPANTDDPADPTWPIAPE